MLIGIGSVVIAIAAFGVSAATAVPALQIGILLAAVPYVALVTYGIGFALNVDKQRKMALVWLLAIESRLH
ncbi:hypothetical protein SAMN05216219_2230 [Mycetocola miduiensis]|uniref:Uncharacterized protein n=1 Tax=Mycetocola miduiensis TaxID=995034 RepID=A0A1I5C5S8_9MICO|nr:hypothetical protein SAMN05216219_2230 [Mycetocola miduiensis]